MTEEKNTVGYTESADYRCLEDLQEERQVLTGNLLRLDYCGKERCKPEYAFGPYTRENYVLHVILEGKGQLFADGKTYPVSKNQAFLLVPGIETVYRADREEPWVYAWIGFHGYQCEKIVQSMGFSIGHYVVDVKDASVLGKYIDRMLDHSQLTFSNYLKRNAYMELLLGEIIEYADVTETKDAFSEDAYVNMAVEYIVTHYYHSVKIAGIANWIGINRSYLAIIFKKKMGVSPQQFLIDFRLGKAAELLVETEQAVRAISAGVGYKDPLAFSKAFKQKYGVNPTQYREHHPVLKETSGKGNYTGIHRL